jgi:Zn-dependent membrane protease YugP
MMLFDPLYFLLLGPTMLLAIWAQAKVKSAYAHAGQIGTSSRCSGAEAARRILNNNGLTDVGIEPAQGFLSDHYDPRHRVLRLSRDVYGGRSLASVGIAAHEAGHAIQQAVRYGPLALRNGLVPLASTGSNLSIMIFMAGLVLSYMSGGQGGFGQTLMIGGILLFSAVVVFQIVNLPVEFNASSRAMAALTQSGIITAREQAPVKKVLNAAALTYVAATLSAVMTLLYLLIRSGLLGGRRG